MTNKTLNAKMGEALVAKMRVKSIAKTGELAREVVANWPKTNREKVYFVRKHPDIMKKLKRFVARSKIQLEAERLRLANEGL